MTKSLVVGDDGKKRCFWASTPLYWIYHDEEWGMPTADDRWIFEKICLEGFQSGLSWLTILNKRENFRKAFKNFEIDRVARLTQASVERLMNNEGIVRNRMKIESTINNAKRARELKKEFGSLAAYVWQYEPPTAERPKKKTRAALRKLAKTPTSVAMSKDLKKRGWSFVGPTTSYAFMQAAGIVNDHLDGCVAERRCQLARRKFKVPR